MRCSPDTWSSANPDPSGPSEAHLWLWLAKVQSCLHQTVQAAFILLWETGGNCGDPVSAWIPRPPCPNYTISCSSFRASPKPVFLSVSLAHRPPHASCHPRLSSRNQFTGGWPRSHGMDVTGGHEWLPRSVIITHTHRE